MTDDRLRMQDPRDQYPRPPFERQPQPAPGLAALMTPRPDHGEDSYVGAGRLLGRRALVTGGDSGVGRDIGYQGYAGLYDRGVTEAACWAHAQRKFFDEHAETKSPLALEALQRIAALYQIEATVRGQQAEVRLATRAAKSARRCATI